MTFRWKAIGMLPGSFSFVVKTSRPGHDELCVSDAQEICKVTLDEEGEYEWWAELLGGGQPMIQSNPRTLYIYAEPTPIPTPTFGTSPLIPTVTP